ncbi:hypothetical protein Tco_0702428 [Tanacetum coccineum]|uniref:Uncharacterized protein n=1 Tax=Tanacetum coccineum TaxID=301880 RepID=A0ABQ4XWS6_9ASTR
MENTMLDLLEICRQKELYCIHNNVEDLIESALNSKLLLINLNSQRLNKEDQEVKNIGAISEFIKSSVEDLIPIPRESEDTSGNDVSIDKDVLEDRNIESKIYVSNLDEPALLVTPLSDANEDECFDPRGVINENDAFLDMDIFYSIETCVIMIQMGDHILSESLLIDDTSPISSEVQRIENEAKTFLDLTRGLANVMAAGNQVLPRGHLILGYEENYRGTRGISSLMDRMALWQSQMEDYTSDWLWVVLISGLGQTMNACSRVFLGDIYGDHAVSCVGIVGIKHWHNVVRDTLVDIGYRSEISSGKEVDIGHGGGRDYGRDVCVDLIELEKDAVTLLKRIQKFFVAQDIGARAAIHIFSRISFAIAKGVGPRYSLQMSQPSKRSRKSTRCQLQVRIPRRVQGSEECQSEVQVAGSCQCVQGVLGLMIGLGSEPIIGSSEEASRRGTWQQQIGGSGMLAAGNDWDTRCGIQAND